MEAPINGHHSVPKPFGEAIASLANPAAACRGECGVEPAQDALDRGPNKPKASTDGKRLSQVDQLIAIGERAELYYAPDGVAYADIDVSGHRQTWPVGSRDFRQHLRHEYYKATGGAPSGEAMATALATLEAKARFAGVPRAVHLRVADLADKLYIDLCNDECGAIEVTKYRWRYILKPPVRFRRARGMMALPMPTRDGDIRDLNKFVSATGDAFMFLVAWLLAALLPRGPYPPLVLSGEQGGGKSTVAAMLRRLVDPHIAVHRAPPRNTHDLYIAASNNHVLALDNLSSITHELSDAMCRLSTGGGFSARKLYTDDEETLFEGQRPIVLTSINDVASRSDLADRALFVRLGALEDEKRRSERELWAEFEKARPGIFGALLTAMVAGLRNLPETRLEKAPRMADFALWIAACESALPWDAGEHLRAYVQNRKDAVETVLGADPLADALQRFMELRPDWTGTASELLVQLNAIALDHVKRDRTWPQAANGLSGRLTRLAPALRGAGVVIEPAGRHTVTRAKLIKISRHPVNNPK